MFYTFFFIAIMAFSQVFAASEKSQCLKGLQLIQSQNQGNLTNTQQQTLREDLLAYCELDTYAMVKIAKSLGSELALRTGDE